MDLEDSFNDFRSSKPKVSKKTAAPKPKKQKRNEDFSGSQVHLNTAAKKNEASLKKFLYSTPNYKYNNIHESKLSVNKPEAKSYQTEEIAIPDVHNDPKIGIHDVPLEMMSQLKTCDEVFVEETLQHSQNSDDKDADTNKSCQNLENSVLITNTTNFWTCPLCNSNFPDNEQNSHFVRCVEQFQSKSDLENYCTDSKVFICDICKDDISFLSTEERSIHMNKCIDSQISSGVDDSATVSAAQSNPLFSECPLCLKKFATVELRSTHVKKCSKSLGISIADTISALQLQERHVLERMSLGLPLPVTKSPRVKSGDKVQKKSITQPKSKSASDIQLAKALSLSMKEEEDKKQEIISSLDNVISSSPSTSFIASLKPPKVGQVPGNKKISKKKKNVNKSVPQLLLRTEDEREKLIQERVSKIIQLPVASCETANNVQENIPSSCEENLSLNEKNILWSLAGKADDKKVYYVGNLLDWIIPSEINAGSKLLNLSQVPGHCIYTQKSCDYTFSSPMVLSQYQSQSKNSFTIPSTQEMLDIMTSDSSQIVTELVNSPPKKHSPINLNHTKAQDGFFFEGKKAEMTTGSETVINSLKTLVGNPWMSDVDIFVENEKIIPAHKLLLMLRCPALIENLSDSVRGKFCIKWGDVSYEAALNFISYLYTGSECWDENEMEIYGLAVRYEMNDLQISLKNKKVADYDEENFNTENTVLCENIPDFEKEKVMDEEENPASNLRCSTEAVSNCDSIEMESVVFDEKVPISDTTVKELVSKVCEDGVDAVRSNTKSTQDKLPLSENLLESSCFKSAVCADEMVSLPCLSENHDKDASKCESTNKQSKSTSEIDEVFTVQNKISSLNSSRIFPKKFRVPSPILFECESGDDYVTESVLNNTTLPIVPRIKQMGDKSASTSYNQSLLKSGFDDSNEITIIHESPRHDSITKMESHSNNYLWHNNRYVSPIKGSKYKNPEVNVDMETVVFENENNSFIQHKSENTAEVPDRRFGVELLNSDDRLVKKCELPLSCEMTKSSLTSLEKSEDCEICILESKPSSAVTPKKLNSKAVSVSQVLNIGDKDIENREVFALNSTLMKTTIPSSSKVSPNSQSVKSPNSQSVKSPFKHSIKSPNMSSTISPDKRSTKSPNKSSTKSPNKSSTKSPNKGIIKSPNHALENSQKLPNVLEMLDSNEEKHDIMILGNISLSVSPNIHSWVDTKPENTSVLNSCVSDVSKFMGNVEVYDLSESPIPSPSLEPDTYKPSTPSAIPESSPCFDKSTDSDEAFTTSHISPETFKVNPACVISPTSMKCAFAAEKRRCAESSKACVQNLQNVFNSSMSYHESINSNEVLKNEPSMLEEICEKNEAIECSSQYQCVSRTFSPVILSSDDEDDGLSYKVSAFATEKLQSKNEVKCLTPKKTSLELSPASSPKDLKPLAQRIQERVKSSQNLNRDNRLCIDLDESSNDSVTHSAISQSDSKSEQLDQKVEAVLKACTKKNTPQSKNPKGHVAFNISDSPLTPLPDYQDMHTPEIKMALKKYGIRALSKKKAVAILSHIYDETHPFVENDTAMCSSQVCSSTTSTDVEEKEKNKKRKLPAKCVNKVTSKVTKKSKRNEQQNQMVKSSSGLSNSENSDAQLSVENLSPDSPQSSDSSKSEDNDLPEESILHFTDTCENEEIGAEEDVNDKIQKFILSNESLYVKILMYEPLNLSDLHDELKNHKIKVALPKLMNFLDEQCITFTFPRKDDYRKKQQARQQNFRKRMINKLSQPNPLN